MMYCSHCFALLSTSTTFHYFALLSTSTTAIYYSHYTTTTLLYYNYYILQLVALFLIEFHSCSVANDLKQGDIYRTAAGALGCPLQ
jgi:hypothetical protein